MNLYTILFEFEDRTAGIDQFSAQSPLQALELFINNTESLRDYDRSRLLSIMKYRADQDTLLNHIANNLKGFWVIGFGTDLLDIAELSSIYGGYIIQTDPNGPERNVN